MKYLTVIRHAKAEDPTGYANDFDRPLTERGVKDLRQTIRMLTNLAPAPDWWISSTAVRARESTGILVDSLGYTKHVVYDDGAYMAEADALLALISQTPEEAEHVVLVGHNPGLEELVAGLCASGSLHLNLRLSTSALAHIELETFRWDQVRWGCGQLRLLVAPKALKKP